MLPNGQWRNKIQLTRTPAKLLFVVSFSQVLDPKRLGSDQLFRLLGLYSLR